MKKLLITSAVLLSMTISAEYIMKQKVNSGISFSANESNSDKPADISQDDYDFLKSELSFTTITKCYDSSISGSDSTSGADMFASCKDKGPIIAMATYQTKSFGGYIPIDLNTNPNSTMYYSDLSSRLFDFNTNTAYAPLNTNNTFYIRNNSNPYIGWGGGHDLVLLNYTNSSYPNGYCYSYTYSGWNSNGDVCGTSFTFSSRPVVKIYNIN